MIMPVATRIAKDLGPFLLLTTEDTLSLVLETLSSVVNVGKAGWLTSDLAEQLSTAMLEVWVKNNRGQKIDEFSYHYASSPLIRSDSHFAPHRYLRLYLRVFSARRISSRSAKCAPDSMQFSQ